MEIKRDFYLKKLIDSRQNGMIKVITGIRRCGKSYLLNTIFYRYLLSSGIAEDHIIRFAFDSIDDLSLIGEDLIKNGSYLAKVDPIKFANYIKSLIKDDDLYYILLDEVQLLDGFEFVLNSFLRRENIDVYVTGSNAKFLSSDVITEFAGRGDEIHLFPLSFGEFITVYNGDKYEGLGEYMLYGGIPLVVLTEEPTDKIKLLQNLFSEIYIRDIQIRHNVRNIGELDDLLNILSSSIGSLTNAEKLKKTFKSVKNSKITSTTITKYIDYFGDSFLIDSALKYDIKGKKYISTPKKYYFTDIGLRNARINFRQQEQTHIMENIIFNELKRRGYNVDVGIVTASVKNEKGNSVRKQYEIDFVCNLGSQRYYIQSAYSMPTEEKHIQEIRPFKNIDDSFKKIIITHDITPKYYDNRGVLTMSIFDFLLDDKSLMD